MRQSLALLLVSLLISPGVDAAPRPSKEAEAAYQSARHAYYVLKDDAHRRKFRHNWLNVAQRFDAVAKKFPATGRAADALFTSAQLHADLSRISMLEDDLRAAIERYEALLEKHPRNPLADDAALALARIHTERTGETERARKVLQLALEKLPRGDMRRQLLQVQSTLPATPAERPRGKRIAARAEAERPAPAPVAEAPKPQQTPSVKAPAAAPAEPADPLLEAIARAARPSEASRPPPAKPEQAPAPSRKEEPVVAAAPEAAPRPVSTQEAKARLKAAAAGVGDEITLAEQLGLKVRRVVIDAGHGGHDTGAIGKKGTREKDVTLAVARRVAEILSEKGLEVVLTRDDDTYVRLEDRTRIANEARGDLFISIHCNAAESRKVRGTETFTLNVASDRYSIRLAARENSASEKSISDLQFILADLATKANTEESQRLATKVQSTLVTTLSRSHARTVNLGTKQALFYVLLGAKMPAILVETAFISHPEEEARLASKAYQEDTAQGIADGVQAFLDDRQRMAKVD